MKISVSEKKSDLCSPTIEGKRRRGKSSQTYLNRPEHRFLVQPNLVRNLLIFLHQKSKPSGKIGLSLNLSFPHLHEHLKIMLSRWLIYPWFKTARNRSKTVRVGFWRVFGEESSDFASKTDGDFDGIASRSFKEEDENLESNNFMRIAQGQSLVGEDVHILSSTSHDLFEACPKIQLRRVASNWA